MWKKYLIIAAVGVVIGAVVVYVAKGVLEAMDVKQNAEEEEPTSE